MKLHWWMILAAVLLLGANAQDDASKKDLEKMQGTWTAVGHEADGKKQTDEEIKKADVKLVMKDDKYTVSFGGQKAASGKVTLDASKKPKTIDAADDNGLKMLGIYEIDGDTMKVVFAQPGKDRATEFKTKEGSGAMFITYKRVKN